MISNRQKETYVFLFYFLGARPELIPSHSHHQDFYTFCRGSQTKPSFATTPGHWDNAVCMIYIYMIYIYIDCIRCLYTYISYLRNVHMYTYIYNPRMSAMKELNTLSAQQSVTTLQQVWPWEDAHEAWVETLGWTYLRKRKQLHKPKENLAWLIHLQKSLHKILEMNIA